MMCWSIRNIAYDPHAKTAGVQPTVADVLNWISCLHEPWVVCIDDLQPWCKDVSEFLPSSHSPAYLIVGRNLSSLMVPTQSLQTHIFAYNIKCSLSSPPPQLNANSCLYQYHILTSPPDITLSAEIRETQYLCRLVVGEHLHNILCSTVFPDVTSPRQGSPTPILAALLAHFHHAHIAEAIFKNAAENLAALSHTLLGCELPYDPDFLRVQSLLLKVDRDGFWDSRIFRDSMSRLCAAGIVHKYSDGSYVMAPVVQEWLRVHVTGRQPLRLALIIIGAAMPSIPPNLHSTQRSCYHRMFPHLQHFQTRALQSRSNTQPFEIDIALRFACAFRANGEYDRTIAIYEALHNSRGINDSSLQLKCTYNICMSYFHAGKLQAAYDGFGVALTKAQSTHWPSHPAALDCLKMLTLICMDLEKWKTALTYAEQSVSLRKKFYADGDPDTFSALELLARVKMGELCYAEALEVWSELVALRNVWSPFDDPDTIHALAGKADCLFRLERYSDAIELQKDVCKRWDSILGSEHPNTTVASADLSQMYLGKGDWRQARQLCLDIVTKNDALSNLDRPEMLETVELLAAVYTYKGDHVRALIVQRHIVRKHLECNTLVEALPSMIRMADMLRSQERWSALRDLSRALMRLSSEENGEGANEVSQFDDLFLKELEADAHFNLGSYADALEIHNIIIPKSQNLLSVDNRQTIMLETKRAITRARLGDTALAVTEGLDTLARSTKLFGPESAFRSTVEFQLGEVYRHSAQWREAEAAYEHVWEFRRRVIGETHPDTLQAAARLTMCRSHLGNLSGAKSLGRETLAKYRALFGDSHPRTLESTVTLVVILSKLGKVKAAKELSNTVQTKIVRHFGSTHTFAKIVADPAAAHAL